MDPLTHTFTGLAINRLGFDEKLPRSSFLLVLAANAPDIDILSRFWGSDVYLIYHRGFTHSWVFSPILAVLVTCLTATFNWKSMRWRLAFIASWLGIASHILLDWTNTYGVRTFSPLSETWYRLDATFIVDLWIWGAFLIAFAVPALSRLLSSEIGAAAPSQRPWAAAALLFLVTYDTARVLAHYRAVEFIQSYLYDRETPQKVVAIPHPLNLFRWQGVVQTSNFVYFFDVNLRDNSPPRTLRRLTREPQLEQQIREWLHLRPVKAFLQFSQFPFYSSMPSSDGAEVTVIKGWDLRFAMPPHERFVLEVVLDQNGNPREAVFKFGTFARAEE